MPILANDPYGGGQDILNVGQSRITPRETYGSSEKGIRATYSDNLRSTDQLVSALGTLSKSFGAYQKAQQDLNDDTFRLADDATKDIMRDNASGGSENLLSRSFRGMFGPPQVSPNLLMKDAHDRGKEVAIQAVTNDPRFLQINSQQFDDPNEYNRQLKEIIADVKTKTLQENNAYATNPLMRKMWEGGFNEYEKTLSDKMNGQAVEKATEIFRLRNWERWRSDDSMNERRNLVKTTVANTVREMGADPVVADQFATIENPQYNPTAINNSRNGDGTYNTATGIFQINDARWDDIKKRMTAAGQGDLAKSLDNRKDEKQNAKAWAWEIKQREAEATDVLGRKPTTAELYMYWIQPGKAKTILSNPDAKLTDVIPESVIKGNPKVFGNGQGTVGDMLNGLNTRMKAGSDYHFQTTPIRSVPDTMLTQDNWDDNATRYKYKWSDFKNNGTYGDDGKISARVVQGLDQLSQFLGRKVTVTSAYRDEDYNSAQPGAAKNSQHIHGNALDVAISDPKEQKEAVKFLASIGITGVGVYNGHIHFDVGSDRSWSKRQDISNDELIKLKNEGAKSGADGGYVRLPGFNGAPIDPYEARIQKARQYGIDPVYARADLIKNDISRALDLAHTDPVTAQTSLANLYTGFNSISETEREMVRKAQSQVNEIQSTAYRQKLTLEQMAADEVKDKWLKQAEEDSRAGRPVSPPDRNAFPATSAGRKAYAEASELGLKIQPMTDAQSTFNLSQDSARLSDPAFYKELGFGEGTEAERPKSDREMRDALLKSGRYNIADVSKLTGEYMKQRVAGGVADQAAADSAAKVTTKNVVHNLFLDQKEALAALSRDFGENKEGFQAKVREYQDRLIPFYQTSLAELVRDAMKYQPNGAPLSYEQMQALEKQAVEHTRAMAVGIGNTIVATQNIRMVDGKTVTLTGPDGKPLTPAQAEVERISRVNDLANPQGVFMRVLQDAQRNGGYVNMSVPGIPAGAQFMLDGSGRPMMNGDAYQMRLPNGSVYYMRPADNILTKEQMNYGTERYGAMDNAPATQQPIPAIRKPEEIPKPNTAGMTKAEAAPVKRKYEEDVKSAQRAIDTAVQETRIDKSVNDQFTKDVHNYVMDVIYNEFKGETKGKALAELPAKVDARYKQLTEHYMTELRPYYDAFVSARTALDQASPDQRKQLKDAYQRALSAWQTVSHMTE